MPQQRSSTKPPDYFQPLTAEPPTALKNNRLAWFAGCELVSQLNTLPFGHRPPRRVPSALRKYLAKRKKLPLSAFPQDLVAARDVVTILLKDGHEAACVAFNERLASSALHLPYLTSKQQQQPCTTSAQRKIRRGVVWTCQTSRGLTGSVRRLPFLSPALALWLILSESAAHPRLLQCGACNIWFFTRDLKKANAWARGNKVYCSPRCRTRQTVADSRSHQRKPSVS